MPGRSYGDGHAVLLCVFLSLLCTLAQMHAQQNILMESIGPEPHNAHSVKSAAVAESISFVKKWTAGSGYWDERPRKALGPIAAVKTVYRHVLHQPCLLETACCQFRTGNGHLAVDVCLQIQALCTLAFRISCFNHIHSHMMQFTMLSTAAVNCTHADVWKTDAARTHRVRLWQCCLHCLSHVLTDFICSV